jgi:hypothetical protein
MNQEQVVSKDVAGKSSGAKFAEVRLGMEVYDRLGKRVGHVDDMHGASDGQPAAPEVMPVVATPQAANPAPVVMPVASGQSAPQTDALGAPGEMPREIHDRLMHDGYIRIDAGFLKHHRYALPDQIDTVDGDHIILTVVAEDLIKH